MQVWLAVCVPTTFKVAPKLFYQLYTLHAVCDFEIAAMNAISATFPSTEVCGCLFHFGQSVWRNTQRMGLQVQYDVDLFIKDSVNYLLALPFVPLVDIADVFEYLYDEIAEDVIPLWQYIEHTYVRGRPARGRRPGSAPLFPPRLWNVHEACLSGFQRTNNYVEGWHSKFSKLIVTPYANFWKFLENLKKEQRNTEQQMIQIEGGHRNIKHPVTIHFCCYPNHG